MKNKRVIFLLIILCIVSLTSACIIYKNFNPKKPQKDIKENQNVVYMDFAQLNIEDLGNNIDKELLAEKISNEECIDIRDLTKVEEAFDNPIYICPKK